MKRFTAFIIILAVLAAVVPINAVRGETESPYIDDTRKLHSLGLMLGTGSGFELERVPSRVEAAIMLVRLLGRESEALMTRYDHPFEDVPEWADPYVGLLYESGLTKGIGGGLYGSFLDVDARTYLTFILRTLGYSDDEDDFTWEDAVGYAFDEGLININEYATLESEEFSRGHMAAMSYNAINTLMKNSDETLASVLAGQGVFDLEEAVDENILLGISPEKEYLRYLEDGGYMPWLEGLDIETARILLRKANITDFTIEYEINEIIPEDCVISQSCPAYISSDQVESCVITLSRGPSLLYHDELMKICFRKGYDEEVIPYIIGAAKYLIKNTVMSKYEVYHRLEENLFDVTILSPENSAALGFAALYDSSARVMYINRYVLDPELVLHELAHTLSNNLTSGKVGFADIGDNTRMVTEAFVESLAAKAGGFDTGHLNVFRTADGNIEFCSNVYFSDEVNNFTLGVFSPLFLLIGENNVETMFFRDTGDYGAIVLDFNETYGEQRWETLWNLADDFIEMPLFMSDADRTAKAGMYEEYLDGIIECLYTDLENAGDDDTLLRLLLYKTRQIKGTYPLNHKDYRQRLENLEREIISSISFESEEFTVAGEGMWIVPDYTDRSSEFIYNDLTVTGASPAVGYMLVPDDGSLMPGVLYKEPDMTFEEALMIEEGMELPLGGEYIILIPQVELPGEGYSLMRDLVEDFKTYLADYGHMSDYAVGRLLKAEGFSYRYEYTYYNEVADGMQGRIVGQFPGPGSAIIPGETVIRIYMLRERRQ